MLPATTMVGMADDRPDKNLAMMIAGKECTDAVIAERWRTPG